MQVGVGPWPGGPDAWPTDPRYDRELLANGDARNVVDRFRYWTIEAIVAELDTHRHGFSVAIENWQHDMNIGSIVRTANAFLAETVHIVGRKRWNKRGAMVTDRYQHIVHHDSVAELVAFARETDRAIVAVDNVPGSVEVGRFRVSGALHPAVRPGGAGADRRGAGCRGCRCRDPAVRFHPIDQRGGGSGDRHARVDRRVGIGRPLIGGAGSDTMGCNPV